MARTCDTNSASVFAGGIEHVLVNGCAVFPQAPPSHRPGRILRRDASVAGAPEFSR
ncbi:hypothetical protein MyNCGM152_59570 [Achromobacter xylosoxidans]